MKRKRSPATSDLKSATPLFNNHPLAASSASRPSRHPATSPKSTSKPASKPSSKHFAVIGAGIAGIACARTLVQAGHQVTVFEKSHSAGGRMSTRSSDFGTFDHGTQYFT
ncbi:MAG: hypothetical protein RL761_1316, partial [Pseudomonadota bacterium]